MRKVLLIATDGGGCHYFAVEISETRYNRPIYMEALENSIEMVFKKLKWHREKNLITITEVWDATSSNTKEAKQSGTEGTSEATEPRATVAEGEGGVQTFNLTYLLGDKEVQEGTPERDQED